MEFREVVAPDPSPYSVAVSVEPLRDECYAMTLSIRNGSTEPLPLNPATFELTAPPAMFLQLTRLRFGRTAFRMPASIASGGVGNGQLFFQMHPGDRRPDAATLHVHLPDGDHQVVFDFD